MGMVWQIVQLWLHEVEKRFNELAQVPMAQAMHVCNCNLCRIAYP